MATIESPPQRPSYEPPSGGPPRDPRIATFVAGVIGGLFVLVVGAILIAAGVIDTGSTKREVVHQASISQGGAPLRASKGLTVNDIYGRDGGGVVFIQARVTQQSNSPFDFGGGGSGVATGSGFVLDKNGDILTNGHVVEGAGAGDVTVRFGNSDEFPAKVIGRDPSSDLALLKVNAPKNKLKPLNLGDSGHVRVGDPVVAIGNPFGFDRTVTTGIVSALQRQIQAPNGFSIDNVIQTDAAINPGNSGGPLIDASGRVIGINSQIATGGSSGSVGIGFAIPINTAKSVISQLKKSGNVQHAYIGITTAQVTKQIAHDLNLPTDHGALVQQVVPGGPAAKAGLRAGRTETTQGLTAGGDLIVKAAGKEIRRPDDVAAAIQNKKPGDQIQLVYFRGAQQHTANVTLGKRPNKLDSSQNAPQSPDQGGGGGTFPLP